MIHTYLATLGEHWPMLLFGVACAATYAGLAIYDHRRRQ